MTRPVSRLVDHFPIGKAHHKAMAMFPASSIIDNRYRLIQLLSAKFLASNKALVDEICSIPMRADLARTFSKSTASGKRSTSTNWQMSRSLKWI